MLRLEELRRILTRWAEAPLAAVSEPLSRFGVSPDHVTWAGALLTLAAAALLLAGHLPAAGTLFLVASVLDMLDGALARAGNRATAYGAFLDSTLDRVGEGAVFAAMAYRFAETGAPVDAGLVVLALLAALLVSYTRARAEGLGVQCRVGLLTRPERVIILGLGMLTARLDIAVYLLVILGVVTVVQRVLHVRRQLRSAGNL